MKNKYISNPCYYACILVQRISYFLGKFNRVRAFFWGVKLGCHSRFKGHCYFKRYKNSSIEIGDYFTAVSTTNAPNLLYRPCTIMTCCDGAQLRIGKGVSMSGVVLACFKKLTIGNNVRIGGNCFIFDGDFHLDDKRAGQPQEVCIGNNVWLGMNVTVLKGVHIGENSLIGAGSIVTKDIPANVVAAGNPCKVIKTLSNR